MLELRATVAQALRFALDEPLANLRYANFDTVDLVGTRSPSAAAAVAAVHPSELFDYVPESERSAFGYNVSLATVADADQEPVIVPYAVYALEQRLAQMATFAGWSTVRVLRLHDCRLAELHWQMFDGLHALRHLSLERNAIRTVPPFALFGVPQLRTLSLAHNDIADLHYRALAGLLQLRRLDLSGNRLRRLSERTFPPFPRLRTLDVRDNPIEHVLPMTFGVMNSTHQLLFGSVERALQLADSEFGSLVELRTLVLTNVSADTLGQGVFAGLRNVQRLTVHGRIRRIEFDAFAELTSVRQLVLSECALEVLSMDTFFGTRSLEVVDLSQNRLAVLPPGLFDGQSRLRELYLQDNRLTALPGDLFAGAQLRLMR